MISSVIDNDTERTVLKFTIRDSEVDVVNVSCWGPKSMVHDLNDLFHIGDVGQLTLERENINI